MKQSNRASPALRILSHQACTGGTLFSKLIANHPSVAILSEISLAGRPTPQNFTPLSPLERLVGSYPEIQIPSDFIKDILLHELAQIDGLLAKQKIKLVVREHAHSDSFLGAGPNYRLAAAWPGRVIGVVTVRYPVMSYISALRRKWISIGYDRYCAKYIDYIRINKSFPVFRYEDLTEDPPRETRRILEAFELPAPTINELALTREFSGNSGRHAKSTAVKAAAKHVIADEKARGLSKLGTHIELCEMLGYPTRVDEYLAADTTVR